MIKPRNKKRRLYVYKTLHSLYTEFVNTGKDPVYNGSAIERCFCFDIRRIDKKYYHYKDALKYYPDLVKYKPEVVGMTWFDCEIEGVKQRIELLDKVIKELS